MLTIVNKMFRKEAYSLSDNVENHRTILTLFYILYSIQGNTQKATKSVAFLTFHKVTTIVFKPPHFLRIVLRPIKQFEGL